MNEVWREDFAGSAPPARATVKPDLAGSQYIVEITLDRVRHLPAR